MSPRRPQSFAPDDPRLKSEAGPAGTPPPLPGEGMEVEDALPAARVPMAEHLRHGIRWGAILVSTAISLLVLSWAMRFWSFVAELLARQDAVGWLATGLAGLLVLALVMILAREVVGFLRLARLARLRASAAKAIAAESDREALAVARAVRRLYAGRRDLAWAEGALAEHDRQVLGGRERLALVDRELVASLDERAKVLVGQSARRVAVVTAITPFAVVDMVFVLYEGLRMLRRIAALYGGKPGLGGLLRLAGHVLAHVVATGGIAMTDDLLGQFIGQGLAKRLSARAGEGMFNGALTARLGVAGIEICRPLPFIEARRPRFRELALEVARGLGAPGAKSTPQGHEI